MHLMYQWYMSGQVGREERRPGREGRVLGQLERPLRIDLHPFGGQRQACVKGHLPVWQVIAVAEGYGMDAVNTATHFGWPVWRAMISLSRVRSLRISLA